MKHILVLLFLIPSFLFAQDLKLIKATKQTINSGASPTSTTNYRVEVKRSKSCNWSVDSVVNVYTSKSNLFNITKVGNSTTLQMDPVLIKQKGIFQITFSSVKNRGSGRPGTPMNLMVPVADFTQGAIIYYRVGKKKKQLTVESFDELETINAP
ncbi:MAG: hypothetical protein H0X46_02775 [Bacteroidetes bacterium]|nr:hypothetical protein [Bacteroidota bacterium]